MLQFILPHGSAEAERAFNALDPFTRGYIEAAFFTCDFENAYTCELAPSALAGVVADCAAWQTKAAKLLALAYDHCDYEAEQAGRDYWFTRNGHGVGFWDRKQLEIPICYSKERGFEDAGQGLPVGAAMLDSLGELLTKLSRGVGSRDMYRGDDELIYFA